MVNKGFQKLQNFGPEFSLALISLLGGLGGFSSLQAHLFSWRLSINNHVQITSSDIGKVWRYIYEKEEVLRTQLERDFSHRLTAEELDEILSRLWDAKAIDEGFEWRRGRGRKLRIFYFVLHPKFFEKWGSRAERIRWLYRARNAKQSRDPRFVLESLSSGEYWSLYEPIEKALERKYIKDLGMQVNVLKMYLRGSDVYEIADKLGYSPFEVRSILRTPDIEREIRRTNKRIEREIIRVKVAELKEVADMVLRRKLQAIEKDIGPLVKRLRKSRQRHRAST